MRRRAASIRVRPPIATTSPTNATCVDSAPVMASPLELVEVDPEPVVPAAALGSTVPEPGVTEVGTAVGSTGSVGSGV